MANLTYYQDFTDDTGRDWRIEFFPHVEPPDVPAPRTLTPFPFDVNVDISGIDMKFDNNLPVGMELPAVIKIKCEFNSTNINSDLARSIIKAQSDTYFEVQGNFAYLEVQMPNVWRLTSNDGIYRNFRFTGVQNLPKSKKLRRNKRGIEYELECTSFFRWACGVITTDAALSYCKLDSTYLNSIAASSLPIESTTQKVYLTRVLNYHNFKTSLLTYKNEYWLYNSTDKIILTSFYRFFTEAKNIYRALFSLILQETGSMEFVNPITETFKYIATKIEEATSTTTDLNISDGLFVAYIYSKTVNRFEANKDFLVKRFATVWDLISALANQTARPYLHDEITDTATFPVNYNSFYTAFDFNELITDDTTELETGYESIDRVEAALPYGAGALAKYTVRPEANNNATTAALTPVINNARMDSNNISAGTDNSILAGSALYVLTDGVVKCVTGAVDGAEPFPYLTSNRVYSAQYFKWISDNLNLSLAGKAANALYTKFGTIKQSLIELQVEAIDLQPQLLGAKIQINTEKIFGLDLSDYVNSTAYVTGIACDDLIKGRWKIKLFVEG